MKQRIIIGGVCLALALSLAGCGGQTAPEQQEPKQEVQQAEPVSMETPAPSIEKETGAGETQAGSVEADATADIGIIEAAVEVRVLEGDELIKYFGLAYDSGTVLDGSIDTRIEGELDILVSMVDGDETIKLPDGYEASYKSWRMEQLFTSVNETVYATGTVNIRESWTADSSKVGSLSTGNSVTRTGIGKGKADGWSRVSLSDGSIAYINNGYLSTTKPVVQQALSSGGSGGQSGKGGSSGGGQSGGQTQQTPAPAPAPAPAESSGGSTSSQRSGQGPGRQRSNAEVEGGGTLGSEMIYR